MWECRIWCFHGGNNEGYPLMGYPRRQRPSRHGNICSEIQEPVLYAQSVLKQVSTFKVSNLTCYNHRWKYKAHHAFYLHTQGHRNLKNWHGAKKKSLCHTGRMQVHNTKMINKHAQNSVFLKGCMLTEVHLEIIATSEAIYDDIQNYDLFCGQNKNGNL